MSIKSALYSAVTTVVLLLVLGNGWSVRKLTDEGDFALQTRFSVANQLDFQFWEQPDEPQTGTAVRLLLLIVLAAVLGGIVGRARPAAAFIGGWGAFLAASVVSAGIFGLIVDEDFIGRPGTDSVDTFTLTASFGTSMGMWLGWLIGLAVLLGSFGRGQPKVDTGRPAPGNWSSSPPPAAFDAPAAPYQPGGYGGAAPVGGPDAPPAAPPQPGTAPPPPAPGGPVIGSPPDRTQVFGEPPARDT
ncbi:MAG TPA: hypothetical protein VF228_25890 [Iamia sp.]